MGFQKPKEEKIEPKPKVEQTKATDAATSAKSELVKDAVPPVPKTNSERTAVANQTAREFNKTTHDMTYKAADGKHVVGKEFPGPDGKPMVRGNDGQLYSAKLTNDGKVESLQPVVQSGKEFKPSGEPIKITGEKTGAPQSADSSRKEKETTKEPVIAKESVQPKETPKEPVNLAKETVKEPVRESAKDSVKEKELKETAKEPIKELKEFRETKEAFREHVREIAVTPVQKVELEKKVELKPPTIQSETHARTSVPDNLATKPEFVQTREKVQPLNVNPEPVSKLAAGGGDQRTSKDDDKTTRKDTTDKLGDKPTVKPIDFKGLPLPFMIGREPGRPEAKVRIDKSDAKPSNIDGKLAAKLDQITDTHKTRLSEVVKAIEKNPDRQFTNPTDRSIATKVRELAPEQLIVLKDWLSGKTLPNFSEISKPLQSKLAGILEAVIGKPQVKQEGKQESQPGKIETKADIKTEKVVDKSEKTEKNQKTEKIEPSKTDKTVKIEPTDTVQIRSVKSEFAEAETTKTTKIAETLEADGDETRKVSEVTFSSEFLDLTLNKIRPRKKPKTRQHETVAVIEKESLAASETIRVTSSGTTDTKYVLTLETVSNNAWVKVREYRVSNDSAEYIIYKRSGGNSVQTLQLSRAQLFEMMENDFKRNAQKHVNEFLGA